MSLETCRSRAPRRALCTLSSVRPSPRLPVLTLGDRAVESHLVELGQLAVGCILLGCVIGTLGQSGLGAQHLQRWRDGRKGGCELSVASFPREGPGLLTEPPPSIGSQGPHGHPQ